MLWRVRGGLGWEWGRGLRGAGGGGKEGQDEDRKKAEIAGLYRARCSRQMEK